MRREQGVTGGVTWRSRNDPGSRERKSSQKHILIYLRMGKHKVEKDELEKKHSKGKKDTELEKVTL